MDIILMIIFLDIARDHNDNARAPRDPPRYRKRSIHILHTFVFENIVQLSYIRLESTWG